MLLHWRRGSPACERLCVDDGLRPGLSVAVNGVVSSLGLLQKVPDGSEVHFLPAVGGG